jgi:hypothetical protein
MEKLFIKNSFYRVHCVPYFFIIDVVFDGVMPIIMFKLFFTIVKNNTKV